MRVTLPPSQKTGIPERLIAVVNVVFLKSKASIADPGGPGGYPEGYMETSNKSSILVPSRLALIMAAGVAPSLAPLHTQ